MKKALIMQFISNGDYKVEHQNIARYEDIFYFRKFYKDTPSANKQILTDLKDVRYSIVSPCHYEIHGLLAAIDRYIAVVESNPNEAIREGLDMSYGGNYKGTFIVAAQTIDDFFNDVPDILTQEYVDQFTFVWEPDRILDRSRISPLTAPYSAKDMKTVYDICRKHNHNPVSCQPTILVSEYRKG